MERNPKRCTQREVENRSKQRTEADSETAEGEIKDEESDFENHGTSERDSCYRPITT